MRFRLIHKLVSYLLVASALSTLLVSNAIPAPTLLLFLTAALFSWFVEAGTRLGGLLDRAGLVFNVVAIAFFGLSLFEVVRSFPEPDLTPLLNLVLFLLAYKLCHRRANRDYLQIYILSFLLVLAGSWMAQTFLFFLAFASYVVLGTWTLILFHLRQEIEGNYLVKHAANSANERITVARVLNSRRVVGKSFFIATGLVALGVLTGAALVFAVVPRVGIGFITGGARRKVNIVGFSDQVRLGSHGVLSAENDAVVLRARVPRLERIATDRAREDEVAQLYWRGTVYDTYRDGQWLRSRDRDGITVLEARSPEKVLVHQAESTLLRREPASPEREKKHLANAERHEIQIVGLSHPVAFGLDMPVAFESRPSGAGLSLTLAFEPRYGGEVALRPMRQLGATARPVDFNGAEYVVHSRDSLRSRRFGAGLPTEELETGHFDHYLTVPTSLGPRVRELAQQITRGKTTASAKAQAVVEWLQKTHTYTTDLKRNPDVPDPLEDFLFHQSAGHCEYFASSTAILLRLAGVPSRYVNGFLGGEWNDLGKHVTVRDNRAHSWVEAYLGPWGWARVDATPVGATSTRMGRVRQLFDSVEMIWNRWVIDYDVGRQITIARKMGERLGWRRGGGGGWKAPDRTTSLVAIGTVIGVYLLVKLWRRRRRTEKAAPRRRSAGPTLFRLYERALDHLQKSGLTRGPSETPREFAARVRTEAHPAAEALLRLTEAYLAARFGDREPSEEQMAEWRRLAQEIEQTARPARARAA